MLIQKTVIDFLFVRSDDAWEPLRPKQSVSVYRLLLLCTRCDQKRDETAASLGNESHFYKFFFFFIFFFFFSSSSSYHSFPRPRARARVRSLRLLPRVLYVNIRISLGYSIPFTGRRDDNKNDILSERVYTRARFSVHKYMAAVEVGGELFISRKFARTLRDINLYSSYGESPGRRTPFLIPLGLSTRGISSRVVCLGRSVVDFFFYHRPVFVRWACTQARRKV